MVSGTPGWIRTNGLLLRRQLLFPAELRAHVMKSGILVVGGLHLRRQLLYPAELQAHIRGLEHTKLYGL